MGLPSAVAGGLQLAEILIPPREGDCVQTVEAYFNSTIAQYSHFNDTAFLLAQEIPSLPPLEIQRRCTDLAALKQELVEGSDQLCLIMECIGPEFLNTSYIGQLQRAIDTSVLACTSLYTEILIVREILQAPCSQQSRLTPL